MPNKVHTSLVAKIKSTPALESCDNAWQLAENGDVVLTYDGLKVATIKQTADEETSLRLVKRYTALCNKPTDADLNDKIDFNILYNLVRAENQLKFQREWNNGTGYFNALETIALPEGNYRTVAEDGRKVLIISQGPGCNAVVFERYIDWNLTLVMNVHSNLNVVIKTVTQALEVGQRAITK